MTEYVFISGKTKWFRHDRPDSSAKDGEIPSWSHIIYPDTKSLEKIRELQAEGMKNVLHKDEDGYWIRFRRPTERRTNGRSQAMAPPLVVLDDGVTPLQGNVGNGSDVTTKLEVYSHRIPGTTRKAKAARWQSTRIDNLIIYKPPGEFTPAEEKTVEGLKEQPRPSDFF